MNAECWASAAKSRELPIAESAAPLLASDWRNFGFEASAESASWFFSIASSAGLLAENASSAAALFATAFCAALFLAIASNAAEFLASIEKAAALAITAFNAAGYCARRRNPWSRSSVWKLGSFIRRSNASLCMSWVTSWLPRATSCCWICCGAR